MGVHSVAAARRMQRGPRLPGKSDYGDGEKVGEVEDIVEDQDLWWLERVFEAECCRQVARRLLLELASAGKAVLVVVPPGTYEIERPGPGGDVVTESVELLPGHVGYLVVDTF